MVWGYADWWPWWWAGFGLIVLVLALYTIIPDLFLHRLGVGSWKRQYTAGVALTFDDGPDPEYTPQVLAALRRHNVKATFFVVGAKVARYPELIRTIRAEGHTLGVHSQRHRYAWFQSPLTTWREWERCAAVVEGITGDQVAWMRPPWGTFNLVTWWWLVRRRKRAVLWNVEAHDWQLRRQPAEIAARIAGKVREGSIILLHDSGGETGAPINTVTAIDLLCQGIRVERKIPILPLAFNNWSCGRRLSFGIWQRWENFYARRYKVTRIDDHNILRLAKSVYHGPELYDENGRLLARRGDMVGEIHIDSIRMPAGSTDNYRIGVQAMRLAKESFPDLAAYIEKDPEFRDIRVFLGLSLLHRAVKRFGFNVREIEQGWFGRWVGFLQKTAMRMYHPAGRARVQEGGTRLGTLPKLVWISRERLLEMWRSPKSEVRSPKSEV